MGFRSDTYRLQQAGWEMAAEQDVRYDRIRLLMRHRDLRLYAVSDSVEYRFRDSVEQRMPVFQVMACNHKYDQMVSPLS